MLAAGALRSVFQPIVDLGTGAVTAYEALVRGPEGPLARPDRLFAAARAGDRLAALDAACRLAASRAAVHHGLFDPVGLFVNVEPEVLDTAPPDDLLEVMAGAAGDLRVVLEITERAIATRPADLLSTVERVRSLGWGVALDDVGAEPLSLAFMPLLRPDVVELDLALTQERPGPRAAEIMSAVAGHAESSGAVVLAEGIETGAHLETARALGATLGQGWFFGRPTEVPDRSRPIAALVAPSAPPPFTALAPGTVLARSTKHLLVEVSKHLEREAMRIGETALVTAAFQHARPFTPATTARYRDLGERAGFVCALGEGMAAGPAPGVRAAARTPRPMAARRRARRRRSPCRRARAGPPSTSGWWPRWRPRRRRSRSRARWPGRWRPPPRGSPCATPGFPTPRWSTPTPPSRPCPATPARR